VRKKILLIAMGVAGLAMAGGKSYSFTLYEPALLGPMKLDPGDYQVSVSDQRALVRSGKTRCEAAVRIETAASKYGSTTVRFENGDGKMHIQEIHVGGTKTRLIFNE
jgi:hypothetical protein